MPANPLGRQSRPGSVTGKPYHPEDGEGSPVRTDGRNRGGRPGPVPREPYYYGERTGLLPGVEHWKTGELDVGLYERQMAGIAALISLANDVAAATRFSE